MKKLFLYMIILLIIFLAAFYITRNIYSEKEPILMSTEADVSEVIDIPDTAELQDITWVAGITAEAGFTKPPVSESSDKYIVGIKNGHVIVYKNNLENIYEYTGVDAGIIKESNNELYERLNNTIHFDDLEDLFKFLESIAS